MNTAIFAGTFDPFTLGHSDVVERAAEIFDNVVVAVAADNRKPGVQPLDVRKEIAELSVGGFKNVSVITFDGLLTDCARKCGASVIIRGLRNGLDFEYERPLCEVYREQYPDIDCMYFISSRAFSHVSSSVVRQLAALGGSLKGYVAQAAEKIISETYKS